jgi:2-keto-4-pentenoate hydratase/2-oxohepta-3-ene-1,7-dioic acid hydratase in catechol pathway
MRIANLGDRLVLITQARCRQRPHREQRPLRPDPQSAFADWDAFAGWARSARGRAQSYAETDLGAPVPRPRQVFAIGLNYVKHAKESGLALPERPMVFTKFPSAITGPSASITLTGDTVDWEVELVVVIGETAHHVDKDTAWTQVAGLTVGQDLSDRTVQQTGSPAQFSMGKSFPGFAPIGPVLVTIDEFANPDDLRVATQVNGETRQDSRTSDLVFGVPELISYLSGIVTLYPGDLIFTGTPEGVGLGRTPPSYLAAGDVLVTTIEGIGAMRHDLVRS